MAGDLTIRIIRNYTAEPMAEVIKEAAQRIGLAVQAELGAFDNVGAEIAALASDTQPPPLAIVTIDLDYFSGGLFSPKWSLAQAVNAFRAVLAAIETVPASCFVLISTFLPGFRTSLPWAPANALLGRGAAAFELNHLLRAFVAERPNRCGLLDFERIAARLGEAATVDRRFGLMMKAPFRQEFIAAAAAEVARILRCRFLPPRKVLVLDCDNTLWGGVVGEAGAENVQLDPYEYPGIAYYRFQSEVLAVAEKGVLICLCSKNDEAPVWQVLDKHPHCLLHRNHLAGYRINWGSKVANLRELGLELNLGLDSMVFVDDDPAECQMVRSQLPEVAVLQVPAKIYEYPGLVERSELFDRLSVSNEDTERVHYYQAEKGRREVQKLHVDVKSFLRDLGMKALVRPVQPADIARASQLCQRTNQFNVTSKRYTESDLARFLKDPHVRMFVLQAEDRFGALGQSGLLILRKLPDAVEVDTFLMSCRIIGRLFDQALFCEGLRLARADWQFDRVQASFVPTAKNRIVAGLWKDYGLAAVEADGCETYAGLLSELKVSFPDVIQRADHL